MKWKDVDNEILFQLEAKSEANTTEIESLKAELAAIKAMLLNSSTTEKEDK